jgi:hypothetical protein
MVVHMPHWRWPNHPNLASPHLPANRRAGTIFMPFSLRRQALQPDRFCAGNVIRASASFDEPASNADNTILQCLRESKRSQGFSGGIMASSGELIRMMNYVDDIATTVRRIVVGSGFISPEERKKLADYMRHSDPNFTKMLEELDKEK